MRHPLRPCADCARKGFADGEWRNGCEACSRWSVCNCAPCVADRARAELDAARAAHHTQLGLFGAADAEDRASGMVRRKGKGTRGA